MAVIARSRVFDTRGNHPSGPLRRSLSKINAILGLKGLILPMVSFLWKITHFETDFSGLIEMMSSQVVVSTFTCSRRPSIFDLLANVNNTLKL